MADEDDKTLEELAQEPKEYRGDQGAYKAHSLKEQIELDRYNAEKTGAGRGMNAIVIQKAVPPGAP